MRRLKLTFFVAYSLLIIKIHGQISDKRLCADEKCSEPISKANTLLRYNSNSKYMLSFKGNEEVTIFSKSAGSRADVWGAEINGKRGYVPTNLIREFKVLVANPTYLVATELQPENTVSPNKVVGPYEVVDGTTIYTNPEEISPSSTINVQATAVPNALPEKITNESEEDEDDEDVVYVDDDKPSGDYEYEEAQEENILINSSETEPVVQQSSETNEEKIKEPTTNENVLDNSAELNKNSEGNIQPVPLVAKLDSNTNENQQIPAVPVIDSSTVSPVINSANENIVNEKISADEISNINNLGAEPLNSYPSEAALPSDNLSEENVSSVINEPTTEAQPVIANVTPVSTEQIVTGDASSVPPTPAPSSPETIPTENVEPAQTSNDLKVNDTITENSSPESTTDTPQTNVPVNVNDQQDFTTFSPIVEEVPPPDFYHYQGNYDQVTPPSVYGQEGQQLPPSPTPSLNAYENQPKYDEFASQNQPPASNVNEDINTDANPNQEQEQLPPENVAQTSEEAVAAQPTEIPSLDQQQQGSEETEKEESSGFFGGIFSGIFGSEEGGEQMEAIKEESAAAADVTENVVIAEDKNAETVPENVASSDSLVDSFTTANYNNDQFANPEQPQDSHENLNAQDPNAPLFYDDLSKSCSADGVSCNLNGFDEKMSLSEEALKSALPTESNVVDPLPASEEWDFLDLPSNTFDILLYLTVTAATILIFSLGHYYIDRRRQEGPLVAKINNLQKQLLVVTKENQMLQENSSLNQEYAAEDETKIREIEMLKEELATAKSIKGELEEQVASLERELETATETGLELNRMLTDFLSSQNESDSLAMMANVEKLQRQLVEQQGTINTLNKTVNAKELENERLSKEIELMKTKFNEMQVEMDQMVLNVVSLQEEKSKAETAHEIDIETLNKKLDLSIKDVKKLKQKVEETGRNLELKNNELQCLQENIKDMQTIDSSKETMKKLLDVSKVKAELQQLRREKQHLNERLQKELESKGSLELQTKVAIQEMQLMKDKYEECDKEKTEAQTRLEVLSGYFKEKETQLQKELNEQQSMWILKQGEANSTVERIKWMQEELQNCKQQNESFKKEILAQEVDFKSQISLLEKRVHEGWVAVRQAERKAEDSKQEAALLRNRLTSMSNQVNEEKQRVFSPMEQNGEIPVSPLHMTMESPASPPLLFPGTDHMSLPPPPFMPPPPGMPFPPMPGVPPFMPPPPAMFPGDHRPPPLGRMSSPPLRSRFSPDSRNYSPYDRESPNRDSYDDEDFDRRTPPPGHRGYSPYNRPHRDYRPPVGPPSRGHRNHKGSTLSSGSGNSNDSLDKSNRQSNNV